MTNDTQRLIERDISARQETRRGTVLTKPRLLNYDTASINRTVFVVDVDIGATRPVRDVVVKSSSGKGGRAYAEVGKAVDIQRNQGGRWVVIGASDRIRATGEVQELNEATDTFSAGVPIGFTSRIRPYDFYSANLSYGIKGYGSSEIVDGNGVEINI
jgi:hypothetical protein